MTPSGPFDLVIVGAGIVGLACARAALQRRWRVLVIDREARAIGASIRNFGFVTVTGQPAGATWRRAMRSRDVWAAICTEARIPVLQRGLWLLAHRQEAVDVLAAFVRTEMGDGLETMSPACAAAREPALRTEDARAAVFSPHELRIEPREAIPAVAAWLEACGVAFLRDTAVVDVGPSKAVTTAGVVQGARIAVCPGPDLRTLFPALFRARGVTLCKLQMLRVAARSPIALSAPVMGDLSFVRYDGYAALPAARALRAVLETQCAAELRDGIHLIVVRSADGSLVVGDSHHYDPSPDPFAPAGVEDRILAGMHRLVRVDGAQVVERWTGVYPSAAAPCFVDAPDPSIRVVSVTSGTGMSTAFALGEEVVEAWR